MLRGYKVNTNSKKGYFVKHKPFCKKASFSVEQKSLAYKFFA